MDEALNALRDTSYVFGGNLFDALRGIYKVDCTGYLNAVLEDSAPTAYDAVRKAQGTTRPSASHYANFFRSLPANGTTTVCFSVGSCRATSASFSRQSNGLPPYS